MPRTLSPAARRFIVDALTLTILTSVGAGLVEWLVLGLPSDTVLWLRTVSAAINLATGGFYGRWRDYVLKVALEDPTTKDRLFAAIAEWFAFVIFQVPLYVLSLLIFGARMNQVLLGTLFCLMTAFVAGPTTGFFLDAVRRATEKTPAFLRRLRAAPVPKEPPANRAA